MERRWVLSLFDLQNPKLFIPLFVTLVAVLFGIGMAAFNKEITANIYWPIFLLTLSVAFTLATYSNPEVKATRMYVGTILLFYVMLAAAGALPGFYLSKFLQPAVQSAEGEIISIRESYRTVLGMGNAIFLNNVKIDAVSFLPLIGPFVLGFSLINTASIVWGISFSEISVTPYWFLGPLAVLLAPDTFTEFSSYVLSLIGGVYFFRGIVGPNRDMHKVVVGLEFFAASLALLYASALLEAFLIIQFNL